MGMISSKLEIPIQLHFIILLRIFSLIFSFPLGFNPVTRTLTKVMLLHLKKCLMQKSLYKCDIFMNELHNFERVENYDKILLHKIPMPLSITGSILQEQHFLNENSWRNFLTALSIGFAKSKLNAKHNEVFVTISSQGLLVSHKVLINVNAFVCAIIYDVRYLSS